MIDFGYTKSQVDKNIGLRSIKYELYQVNRIFFNKYDKAKQ